jgi:hypothetical protein
MGTGKLGIGCRGGRRPHAASRSLELDLSHVERTPHAPTAPVEHVRVDLMGSGPYPMMPRRLLGFEGSGAECAGRGFANSA